MNSLTSFALVMLPLIAFSNLYLIFLLMKRRTNKAKEMSALIAILSGLGCIAAALGVG